MIKVGEFFSTLAHVFLLEFKWFYFSEALPAFRVNSHAMLFATQQIKREEEKEK